MPFFLSHFVHVGKIESKHAEDYDYNEFSKNQEKEQQLIDVNGYIQEKGGKKLKTRAEIEEAYKKKLGRILKKGKSKNSSSFHRKTLDKSKSVSRENSNVFKPKQILKGQRGSKSLRVQPLPNVSSIQNVDLTTEFIQKLEEAMQAHANVQNLPSTKFSNIKWKRLKIGNHSLLLQNSTLDSRYVFTTNLTSANATANFLASPKRRNLLKSVKLPKSYKRALVKLYNIGTDGQRTRIITILEKFSAKAKKMIIEKRTKTMGVVTAEHTESQTTFEERQAKIEHIHKNLNSTREKTTEQKDDFEHTALTEKSISVPIFSTTTANPNSSFIVAENTPTTLKNDSKSEKTTVIIEAIIPIEFSAPIEEVSGEANQFPNRSSPNPTLHQIHIPQKPSKIYKTSKKGHYVRKVYGIKSRKVIKTMEKHSRKVENERNTIYHSSFMNISEKIPEEIEKVKIFGTKNEQKTQEPLLVKTSTLNNNVSTSDNTFSTQFTHSPDQARFYKSKSSYSNNRITKKAKFAKKTFHFGESGSLRAITIKTDPKNGKNLTYGTESFTDYGHGSEDSTLQIEKPYLNSLKRITITKHKDIKLPYRHEETVIAPENETLINLDLLRSENLDAIQNTTIVQELNGEIGDEKTLVERLIEEAINETISSHDGREVKVSEGLEQVDFHKHHNPPYLTVTKTPEENECKDPTNCPKPSPSSDELISRCIPTLRHDCRTKCAPSTPTGIICQPPNHLHPQCISSMFCCCPANQHAFCNLVGGVVQPLGLCVRVRA